MIMFIRLFFFLLGPIGKLHLPVLALLGGGIWSLFSSEIFTEVICTLLGLEPTIPPWDPLLPTFPWLLDKCWGSSWWMQGRATDGWAWVSESLYGKLVSILEWNGMWVRKMLLSTYFTGNLGFLVMKISIPWLLQITKSQNT